MSFYFVVTFIIILLIVSILLIDLKIMYYSTNQNNLMISLGVSLCGFLSLFIGIYLLWCLKYYQSTIIFNFNGVILFKIVMRMSNIFIAKIIRNITLILTIPLLVLIFYQFIKFYRNNYHKVIDSLLIFVDSFFIIIIMYLYLFHGLYDLTHSDAHGLFPLVLGCAICSFLPFCMSIYMYISSHIHLTLCIDDKRELLDICSSGGIESLSMLGISLTFDSILYTADKYLSVGIVYWGTYFFMIISLLIIAVNVTNKINEKIC